MRKQAKKAVIATFVIGLLAASNGLYAQAKEENHGIETGTVSKSEAGEELTAAETKELATDLREAITENIGMAEVAEAKGEDAPAEEQAAGEADEPGGEAADEPREEPEEELWYHRFNTITNALQTVPDRIPVLKDKGWIHFGRAELEYANYDSGRLEDDSGFHFRSLRGGIIRQFDGDRTVKLEIDLTDGDSNWVDLWGRFKTRAGLFTVGNQRVAQTLINQTSRVSRTFMEVPLPAEAFGLDRRLGVGWDFHLRKVGTHITAFGADLNDNIGDFGYGARFYFNPAKTRFNMFHIGISAVREKMDRDARFRTRPESRVTDIRLVDTDRDADVDTQSIYGLEIAGAQDNWSVRGEYFLAEWDRISSADPKFDGYYVQANWAITGEPFKYAQGKFLRIRPQSSRGAWELALRYSNINLNDLDVQGGEQRNLTLGANWYGPGNQLRITGNLIFVDTDAAAGNEDPMIFQIRAQLHW